jgi:hypothetical protein
MVRTGREVRRRKLERQGEESNLQRRLVGTWLTKDMGLSRNWQMYFAAEGLVKT